MPGGKPKSSSLMALSWVWKVNSEDLFGGGSREDRSFIDVTNHNVEPMLAAGLLVASPWFICGNLAIVSHALSVCFNSISTGASLFNSFLVDWPNCVQSLAVRYKPRKHIRSCFWRDRKVSGNATFWGLLRGILPSKRCPPANLSRGLQL